MNTQRASKKHITRKKYYGYFPPQKKSHYIKGLKKLCVYQIIHPFKSEMVPYKDDVDNQSWWKHA